MRQHRTATGVYPEGHTIVYHQKYCIIFGQPSQAICKKMHIAGCYFYTQKKRKEDDYVG